jgi:hypothetical protein
LLNSTAKLSGTESASPLVFNCKITAGSCNSGWSRELLFKSTRHGRDASVSSGTESWYRASRTCQTKATPQIRP